MVRIHIYHVYTMYICVPNTGDHVVDRVIMQVRQSHICLRGISEANRACESIAFPNCTLFALAALNGDTDMRIFGAEKERKTKCSRYVPVNKLYYFEMRCMLLSHSEYGKRKRTDDLGCSFAKRNHSIFLKETE